nr:hypothetical protein [Tanacetum cinerariifolium]
MDDIIFGSLNLQLCQEFEALMHEKFQMSAMGELNFFLGLQVLQKEDVIFLSQDKYVGDILKKFRYTDVRSSNTPMDKENPWGREGTGKDVDLHFYRSMIGSLMYLTTSRPDIMFDVCACARHQVTPKECHLHAVKRIFRYLKGHPKLGLWYPKDSPFDLVSFSDSDYGGATQDRKSTTGGCQFLGRRLISWQCKKQTIVATSTTKAEYVEHVIGGFFKGILNIYTSFFWSTARIETTEEGTKILATVDGIVRNVSESSLRRNLKLRDVEGISSLPDADLFENLTLMGYNISPNQKFTFQKGQFSHQWKYLIHTIMQCLSPKSTGFNEFSSNITTFLMYPSPSFSGRVVPLFDAILQYTRRARIAQSCALPPVADEPASPVRDVSQGEAFPTDSGFIADYDRATIAKSSNLPHDSAPRVTSPVANEGNDAPIKRRSMDEGKAATERISDDTEEMVMILTSIDAAIVLVGGIDDVPTGSGSIPTAGPPATDIPTGSDVVPTSSPVFATATVRTEEQQEREDKRMSEQIARDAEVARIHAEEELQKLPLERRIELVSDLVKYQENYAKIYKFQSQQRKSWTKKQKRDYYMAVIRNNLGWKVKYLKGMTFEEVVAKFNSVYKQMEDFIPIGSKEEAERNKRKGIRFDQESSKKLKSSEEVIEEAKSTDEIPKEKIKEMMQLIPIEEVYVEALQEYLSIRPASSDKEMELWVELKRLYKPDPEDQLWAQTHNFMHAPIEWKLYDLSGVHQVTAKDKEIFMLVEKDFPLRKGLAFVMICYKLQVENFSQMANDLVLKIYKIANSPRQQEVEKLLDAGLIYPISDSPWVIPVHCVPKKGGFTVVKNEKNELIPTRLVTGWRVCIDYRKLNDATRKDNFPLPFMDQMLERLAGNE